MVLRRASVGKFEGGLLINEYIYDLTMEGGPDEEAGSVPEMGVWYGIMRGNLLEAKEFAKEQGDTLTKEEEGLLRRAKGVIVSEDNSGFFSVEWYTSKLKMERDWRSVLKDEEEFYADVEEDLP